MPTFPRTATNPGRPARRRAAVAAAGAVLAALAAGCTPPGGTAAPATPPGPSSLVLVTVTGPGDHERVPPSRWQYTAWCAPADAVTPVHVPAPGELVPVRIGKADYDRLRGDESGPTPCPAGTEQRR